MWDALGRRIAARLHHPENTQQLKQMLIEEWVLLPQEMLHQQVLMISEYAETVRSNHCMAGERRRLSLLANPHQVFSVGERSRIDTGGNNRTPSTSRQSSTRRQTCGLVLDGER
ncbi:hypothetical protein TNCV_1843391 [Trichonephila clavipes]|nr:hypothetical protein TNCV_1843391 [Trichonephila clavipes]